MDAAAHCRTFTRPTAYCAASTAESTMTPNGSVSSNATPRNARRSLSVSNSTGVSDERTPPEGSHPSPSASG